MCIDDLEKQIKEMNKSLRKENPEYQSFKTPFGKKFEENFTDLIGFCNISLLISLIEKIGQNRELLKQNNLLKDLKENLPEEKKQEAAKLQECLDLIREMDTTSETLEEEKQESSRVSSLQESQQEKQESSLFKSLRIIERLKAYFILTLYAYIDLYSMSLFQFVVSFLDAMDVFPFINKIRPGDSPAEKLKQIMVNIKGQKKTTMKNLWKKLRKKYSMDIGVLSKLEELRNLIAHRNPLPGIQMLEEQFHHLAKAGKKKAKKFRKRKTIKEHSQEFIRNILETALEADWESLFIFREIGHACYRNVGLIDILIDHWFGNNRYQSDINEKVG